MFSANYYSEAKSDGQMAKAKVDFSAADHIQSVPVSEARPSALMPPRTIFSTSKFPLPFYYPPPESSDKPGTSKQGECNNDCESRYTLSWTSALHSQDLAVTRTATRVATCPEVGCSTGHRTSSHGADFRSGVFSLLDAFNTPKQWDEPRPSNNQINTTPRPRPSIHQDLPWFEQFFIGPAFQPPVREQPSWRYVPKTTPEEDTRARRERLIGDMRRELSWLTPEDPIISKDAEPIRLENGSCYGFVKVVSNKRRMANFGMRSEEVLFIVIGDNKVSAFNSGSDAMLADSALQSYWNCKYGRRSRNRSTNVATDTNVLWTVSLQGADLKLKQGMYHENWWKASFCVDGKKLLRLRSTDGRMSTFHGWKMAFENALADSPERTFFDPNALHGKNLQRYEELKYQLGVIDSTPVEMADFFRRNFDFSAGVPVPKPILAPELPYTKEEFVDHEEARKQHMADVVNGIEMPQFSMKSRPAQASTSSTENDTLKLKVLLAKLGKLSVIPADDDGMPEGRPGVEPEAKPILPMDAIVSVDPIVYSNFERTLATVTTVEEQTTDQCNPGPSIQAIPDNQPADPVNNFANASSLNNTVVDPTILINPTIQSTNLVNPTIQSSSLDNTFVNSPILVGADAQSSNQVIPDEQPSDLVNYANHSNNLVNFNLQSLSLDEPVAHVLEEPEQAVVASNEHSAEQQPVPTSFSYFIKPMNVYSDHENQSVSAVNRETFHGHSNETISEVKHKIGLRLNYSVDVQSLVYQSKILLDHMTLAESRVGTDSTVQLFLGEGLLGGARSQVKCLNVACDRLINYRAKSSGLCKSCVQFFNNERLVQMPDGTYAAADTVINDPAANPVPAPTQLVPLTAAERMARMRANENEEEAAARLREQHARQQTLRADENEEERAARLREQQARQQLLRETENEEERAERRELNRVAHQVARANETEEEAAARLEEQQARQRRLREQQNEEEAAEVQQAIVRHSQQVEVIQRATADQVAVERLVERMKETANNKIGELQNLLEAQLNVPVIRPEGVTDDQHRFRQLGRRPYHIKGQHDDPANFQPMNDLFDEIVFDFAQGAVTPRQIPQAVNVQEPVCVEPAQIHTDPPTSAQILPAVDIEFLENEVAQESHEVHSDRNEDEPDLVDEEAVSDREVILDLNLANARQQYVDEADAEVIEQFVHNEDDRQAIGPVGAPVLRKITYIRRCNTDCPVLTVELANVVYDLLAQFVLLPTDAVNEFMQRLRPELNNQSICQFVDFYSPCYSGLRTIAVKLKSINNFSNFTATIPTAANRDEAIVIMTNPRLPKPLKMIAADLFFTRSIKHRQDLVQQRFKQNINGFRREIGQLEAYPCDVCHQLRRRTDLQVFNRKWDPIFRRPNQPGEQEQDPEEVVLSFNSVCQQCARSLRTNKMPQLAVQNGMGVAERQPLLDCLNWIELALIQLVRPVQTMVKLTDAGGHYTNIRATRGVMVLLPVPVEGTFDHLVCTLPSADNLKLAVTCKDFVSVVNLPRVLKALRWLKENNHLYANVTINEAFRFTADDVIFDKPPTDDQLAALVELGDDHAHLLQPANVQMITNNAANQQDGTAFQQYALKKLPYNPEKWDHPNVDAKCFPQLFPDGNFGYHDSSRPRAVPHRMQIRSRILNADRRFGESPGYLALANGLLIQKDVQSVMATNVRMKKGKLNATDLMNMVNADDYNLRTCMSSMFANLRNYAPYWQNAKLEVKSKIALLGPPTWFLTLNPSERDWKEVQEAYSIVYKQTVDASNVHDFIARDPAIWCRHFQQRVRAFMKHFFKENGPLGKVIEHFYRIEYQKRGTEHIHCLVWVEGAPKPEDSKEDLLRYIDERVTARLPDPETEPELYDLVTRLQMHHKTHSTTCRRKVRYRGNETELCRFEFPRPTCPQTQINKLAEVVRGLPGAKKRPYSVARKEGDEQWINDYNPAILLAWGGNVDIQYVMSDMLDVVNYITGYTTKHEPGGNEDMLKELNGNVVNNSDMFNICMDLIRKRQIGMMEIVDTLMGHPLRSTGTAHVFIDTNAEHARQRILKPKAVLEQSRENQQGDVQAYANNWNDHYYPQRPDRLAEFSLFNLRMYFQKVGEKSRGEVADDDAVFEDDANESESGVFWRFYSVNDQRSPFYFHPDIPKSTKLPIANLEPAAFVQKTRAHFPRLYWPKLEAENEANREDFYRRLCMLFIPWRVEADLKGGFEFYEGRWSHFIEELGNTSPNALRDINAVINQHTAILQLSEELFERRRAMRAQLNEMEIEEDFDEAPVMFERTIDEAAHQANVARLNAGQQEIFNRVCDALSANGNVRLIVLGTAGVGKSALIDALADQVTLSHTDPATRSTKPSVAIAAPTGLAAVSIRGNTLHSLFGIHVQKGKDVMFKELRVEKLNQLREFFSNCKLLIIDEISMCSNILLTMVHLRCQQIMGRNELFGGLSVILLGDVLQLPPVRAPHVFMPLKPYDLQRYFNSVPIGGVSLWSQFLYAELTENMRQRDDLAYAETMGRMRVQQISDDDLVALKSRLIPDVNLDNPIESAALYYRELMKEDPMALAIFSTNEEVHNFNNAVIEVLNLQKVVIVAEDSWSRKPGNEVFERPYQRAANDIRGPRVATTNQKSDVKISRAAGLEMKLELAVGGRVMLRRNLKDKQALGLINGSTGVLESIIYEAERPRTLKIKFDRVAEVQSIERESAIFDIGLDDTLIRNQFPVSMAFGVTAHKCQGLTVDNVLISTQRMFADGQAFVAFSRVKKLDGLHLIDLDPSKMTCDVDALVEYNQRRQAIGLDQFVVPAKKSKPAAVRKQKRHATGLVLAAPPAPKRPRQQRVQQPQQAVQQPIPLSFFGEQNVMFLALKNRGTDCFLIAAVNFLHASRRIMDWIIPAHFPATSLFLGRLQRVLSGTSLYVALLRERLGNHLSDTTRQHDSVEAVTNILANAEFEAEVLSAHQHVSVQGWNCGNCGWNANVEYTRKDVATRNLAAFAGQQPQQTEVTFDDLILDRTGFLDCIHCGTRIIGDNRIEFMPESKYFILFLNRQHQNRPQDGNQAGIQEDVGLRVVGLDVDRTVISGVDFRLIAAIEFQDQPFYDARGNFRRYGHYLSWRRNQLGTWTRINDSVSTEVAAFPTDASIFSGFMFERLD